LGDQAVVVLLLELLDEIARLFDARFLGARHHHVVLAERDTGLERMMEAECHDAVAEDHRLFLPAVAIDRVDHAGDFALRHELVDEVERNLRLFRQYLAENGTTGSSFVLLAYRFAVLVGTPPDVLYLAVQP